MLKATPDRPSPQDLYQRPHRAGDPTGGGGANAPRLTSRELEVLRLVAMGWDTPRIAHELNISPHTVLNHIRHFRRKLDAPTKLDAVVSAIRLRILPID